MSLTFTRLVATILLAASIVSPLAGVSAADIDAHRMALERRYTTPHSLGSNYVFDPRDGWETVNTTNLAYKYSSRADLDSDLDLVDDLEDSDNLFDARDELPADGEHSLAARAHKVSKKSTKKAVKKAAKKVSKKATSKAVAKPTSKKVAGSVTGGLTGSLKKVVDTLKGIGKPEPVIITWYTGHDLLNPSCWANTDWHPSDGSFAAALTMEGWKSKPSCFKFLELCHNPTKCVFVRVVDSCAGCATGSKHVDLTKAAFSSLADLDTGLLTVQMRPATDPQDGWLEDLWGPRA